jgi:hypothetical protein
LVYLCDILGFCARSLLILAVEFFGFMLKHLHDDGNEPCGLILIFFPSPFHFSAQEGRNLLSKEFSAADGEVLVPTEIDFTL